ncbi:MAG: flagellar export chaperone FliS [Desulfocapsaceae bacterium]|nr:flagellar export chaperone FliS [Desulfocapsaceae bacterium]
MNTYINQYQNNQILNATPERILIMLYDGAIRFCRQAMQAMDDGNREQVSVKIGKTMAIICEFSNTLNHEVGGDIAKDLDALYDYMTRELTKANLKNERKALETVEDLLSGLRETWVEAAQIYAIEKNKVADDSRQFNVAASF